MEKLNLDCITGVERVWSMKRKEYIAMSEAALTCAVSSALKLTAHISPPEIVPKQVISDRQAYMKLLARLHEMYVELNSDNISG